MAASFDMSVTIVPAPLSMRLAEVMRSDLRCRVLISSICAPSQSQCLHKKLFTQCETTRTATSMTRNSTAVHPCTSACSAHLKNRLEKGYMNKSTPHSCITQSRKPGSASQCLPQNPWEQRKFLSAAEIYGKFPTFLKPLEGVLPADEDQSDIKYESTCTQHTHPPSLLAVLPNRLSSQGVAATTTGSAFHRVIRGRKQGAPSKLRSHTCLKV